MPPTQKQAAYSLWDSLTGREHPTSPKTGYSNLGLIQFPYFDSDWRYVDALSVEERTWVERWKRMPIGDQSLLSIGGNYWVRYMGEHNSR
ncbi:MAG: hypothetical protein ACKOUR_08165, partial [Planctomycetota bacterium]